MNDVFDSEQKRVLAGRARTLHERLADPDALEPTGRDESEVEELLEEWRERFPDDEAFSQRLDRLEVTEDVCRESIRSEKLAEDEPLPEWVERLEELVGVVQEFDPDDLPESFGPDRGSNGELGDERERERRFAELSAAVAAYARDRLPEDPVRDALSAEAIGTMAEWLRNRFESWFLRVLYVEFKTFVASHDRELAFADPDEFDEPPTEYYEQFVNHLFTGGLAELCQRYPVFARLLATQIRQWDEHLREFSRRLRADRDRLADEFGVTGELGAVTTLEPLADDTHGDGRAVMRIAFDSGVTVAYKPRSVTAGETFYRILDRLNDYLSVPDFETPTYVAGDGYGWMEWVERDDCADREAVERYYQRAGALVCVAYFLEFRDCQIENLVTAGEHPTLVDAETVLHPYVGSHRRPSRTGVGALRDDSVLLTLLLPYGVRNASADLDFEMLKATSGIAVSGEEVEREGSSYPRIVAADTDVMSVVEESPSVDRSENVPTVDGEPHSPDEYLDTIVDGFETTYETVLELHDDGRLADEIGLLDAFESVENRVVYRPTLEYGALVKSMTSRSCLEDGARFGIEMEELAVPFCNGRIGDPKPWPLCDAEMRVLKRLDPPRFTCRTDETALRIRESPIDVEADASGISRARRRIESASRSDMREQVELVRGSLAAVPNPDATPGTQSSVGYESVDGERLQREATDLFDRVEGAAFETEDGTYHWASIEPQTGSQDDRDPFSLRPAYGSLYIGRCGIGLFGAGLYRVTGEERYREFALDAVGPVRDALRSDDDLLTPRNSGGTTGIGAVAYGLGVTADLLGDADLLADATKVADLLTPEVVEVDETYDVVGGSAGTILGLLALYDRRESLALLEAAVECGDHLLDSRVESEGGVPVWKTVDETTPLVGFAHGVGGIAYALVRLSDATGRSEYRKAALEALEFESRAFSESEQNWPNYRDVEQMTQFPDQWCHGRSGVGLSRLGMTEYVTDDRAERGLERAVESFPSGDLHDLDHLCCGNAGRAEFLLETEQRLGRRSSEARSLLGGVLARKRETGTYCVHAKTREVPDPTFFLGLSGIGYTMLRANNPEALPCALLWE
ncbi:type 2 lanthipeptide synthetase LanM family protein [Halorussus sp. MSC15.2]|uniref:type 2 lanthipeptide synthetase LanM family protein n=1 Tax=Halorussus sp. MSC15.2 TaxID=2283638 RepID=UPI0013D8DEE7|nr:type 2 lanthipeptide synthetase LanM family protein [Halorussus sp. MSC15.2]NEU57840.1 type 2 lantipeptide synthetase LanM [Halorussus sp. MSC15.2]